MLEVCGLLCTFVFNLIPCRINEKQRACDTNSFGLVKNMLDRLIFHELANTADQESTFRTLFRVI